MEMTQPLISVIVPIYNVENYLRKCLNSLREQNLREIEVICIDDGSTDESGRIADEYENYQSGDYPIFRVVHTENSGLSAARNRGLDEARAEWIMFVDSDDWVEPDFCRVPYEAAIENETDMVIFRDFKVLKNGKIEKSKHDGLIGTVDELTAYKSGGWAVWNKIYKRRLFINVRYPQGRLYEDHATTHKLVHEADSIIIIGDYLYYYVDRADSITHTRRNTDARDVFLAEKERYADYVTYGLPVKDIKDTLYASAISFMAHTEPSDDELYLSAKDIVDSIIEIPQTFTFKQKAAYLICRIDDKFFSRVCRLLRKWRGGF